MKTLRSEIEKELEEICGEFECPISKIHKENEKYISYMIAEDENDPCPRYCIFLKNSVFSDTKKHLARVCKEEFVDIVMSR